MESTKKTSSIIGSGNPISTDYPLNRKRILPSQYLIEEYKAIGKDADKISYPNGIYKSTLALTNVQREIEAKCAAEVAADIDWLRAKYERDLSGKGNKTLDVNRARELFAAYTESLETRALNAVAVHEPAGAVIKELWHRWLKRTDLKGPNRVIFTAGGDGSGKSTAAGRIEHLSVIPDEAQIIYVTTMFNEDSAIKKIDEALSADKKVGIVYLHCPIELAVEYAIRRACPRKDKFTGEVKGDRTLPAEVLADTHYEGQRVFFDFTKRYGMTTSTGYSQIEMIIIDNSGQPEEAHFITDNWSEHSSDFQKIATAFLENLKHGARYELEEMEA